MTDVITKVGEYKTVDGIRAVVEYVNEEWAFGRVDTDSVIHAITWFKLDGGVQYHNGSRLSIVGPYVPARKRVEGWVSTFGREIKNERLVLWKDRDMAMVADQRPDRCVFVREIDPAAEKEAREALITLDNMWVDDGDVISKMRCLKALSLLLLNT